MDFNKKPEESKKQSMKNVKDISIQSIPGDEYPKEGLNMNTCSLIEKN
jgi:hypothetical protein